MKKTRFFLMALLLVTMLVFTSCGNDDNKDNAADNPSNNMEQDVKDGAEDVKDDAEDLGDDMKDGVEDAADDVEDALDPDGGDKARTDGRDGSGDNDAKTAE